jgi:hypothetical protein
MENDRKQYWLKEQEKIPNTLRKFWNPNLLRKNTKETLEESIQPQTSVEKNRNCVSKTSEDSMAICDRPSKTNAKCQSESILLPREKMLLLLEQRIRIKLKSAEKDVKTTAKAVEHLLFKTASTPKVYEDPETLDKRLYAILAALMKRKVRKISREHDRTVILKHRLGIKTFEAVQVILREIQLLRLGRVALGCNKLSCNSQTKKDLLSWPVNKVDLPKGEKLPQAVKNIFFKNELTKAWQTTQAVSLANHNWEELVASTEKDIEAYKSWASASLS